MTSKVKNTATNSVTRILEILAHTLRTENRTTVSLMSSISIYIISGIISSKIVIANSLDIYINKKIKAIPNHHD